ncbi:DUF6287 domain-containing protein [Streptococcus pantholopis]|uniref:DUF6287 domain-containing protein n=1 Tax=Streptococcus pantholopis TaxID=1811193 RepID=A0A172Q5T7_9STRE|nr:DUF6287 domain-containing protein [Streptococcus pantholopis]AND78806.1 hypothetical protein A0O21_01560 [Streptococcus pantholopis]
MKKRNNLVIIIAFILIAIFAVFLFFHLSSRKESKNSDTYSNSKTVQTSSGFTNKKKSSEESELSADNSLNNVTQDSEKNSGASITEKVTEAEENNAGVPEADQSAADTSNIDINTIANGDFATLSGTWQNANGDSLTFDNYGLVSESQYIQFQSLHDGKASFTIGTVNAATGSAALWVIPAGTTSVAGNTFDQDVLTVGQGAYADSTPYYKISE